MARFFQTTASESTLISLLAGRWRAIKKHKESHPDAENGEINGKLVAYCSDQAHSSVEKAALIGLVHIRYVECDENLSMRGPDLLQAIKKDRELGFVPFWVRELSLSRVSTQITNWGNLLKSDPTRNPPGRN